MCVGGGGEGGGGRGELRFIRSISLVSHDAEDEVPTFSTGLCTA